MQFHFIYPKTIYLFLYKYKTSFLTFKWCVCVCERLYTNGFIVAAAATAADIVGVLI